MGRVGVVDIVTQKEITLGYVPVVFFYISDQIYTTVAGGAGRFVAAATFNNASFFDEGADVNYCIPTAAAAVSNDGSSWSTVPLPGAVEAVYIDDPRGFGAESKSTSQSVVFVPAGKDDGYFVITATGFVGSGYGVGTYKTSSQCWVGDGYSWSMVKSAADFGFGTVSVVAKDLSETTIVNI